MIEVKLIEVAGVVSALKALHLPFGKEPNSEYHSNIGVCRADWSVSISEHDVKLIKRLIKSGDEHAKVMRGIVAYFEINAPRYWWQEFDTYRIGCEKLGSESTMHIQGKNLSEEELVYMKSRLPEGTMQRRIVMISYQTLRRMLRQRRGHRLPEWREFCRQIESLPYNWMIYEK